MFGHVTVDFIAFPDPTNMSTHPLFWAVDINCYLTDYAVACLNFDLLLEGKLDKITGQYFIEAKADPDDILEKDIIERSAQEGETIFENRCFMFSKFIHHPGLA